jgi:hypothetical protein
MECQKDWGINDLDIVDNLIEQMNVKLAVGEAFSQLQSSDYITLANFLFDNPNAQLASLVIQRVGDYVSGNPAQFTIDERNSILRSLMSARYKVNVGEPMKLTPESIKKTLRTGFGIPEERMDIDIGHSAADDRYTVYFKDIDTRL